MNSKREIGIDLLKVLGIFLIILAHINPPGIIFQLRNFDVVLLVILSGLLSRNSCKKCDNYFKYIKKRFIRLILPVWIFLTFFFGISAIVNNLQYSYSLKEIIRSYLMLDGIGYVWIFRIYMLGAITVPILINMKENIRSKKYYLILILTYILYEVIYFLVEDKYVFLEYIIYYIIPYGICIALGLEIRNMSNKTVLKTSIIFLLIFLILAVGYFNINDTLITTNKYKYPPRLYYLSYGIGMSLLVYYIIDRTNIFNIKEKLNIELVEFISTHTMWIYLWHIVYLKIIDGLYFSIIWIVKFILILLLSITTTYIQTKLIRKIKNNFIKTILDC